MKTRLLIQLTTTVFLLQLVVAPTLLAKERARYRYPVEIDLVLCLDTSGSMSGLIESAKQKLWVIVNDLAWVEPTPDLRVALLTFGNDGHNPENGWVEVQAPFTRDLDLISEKLFALTTNGGTEYVGRVLQRAGQLDWHRSPGGLRIAVVAGNESADQDRQAPFRHVCRDLATRGVIVNSIYCGNAYDPVARGWAEVAHIAGGAFATIDHNEGTIIVPTPFDDPLGRLGTELNGTYIAFGGKGKQGRMNQEEQDKNAASLGPSAAAERAVTKASRLYRTDWDLVEATEAGGVELDQLDEEALPDTMKKMSPEGRKAYVAQMKAKRQQIQKEIQVLTEKRERYIDQEMKRRSLDASRAFDNAVRSAIRAQAEQEGFRFKDAREKSERPEGLSSEGVTREAPESKARKPQSLSSAPSRPLAKPMTDSDSLMPAFQQLDASLSAGEQSALDRLLANALWTRSGDAKSDARQVAGGVWVVPDIVVAAGNENDWNEIRRLFGGARMGIVTYPYEILVRTSGQTILINDGE